MRAILVLVSLAGCGDGSSGSSDDVASDGPPPPPAGTTCVPDDAAGTTWDDAAGVNPPAEKLVIYAFGEFAGRSFRHYIPENPRGVVLAFEGGKVFKVGDGTKETAGLEWDPLYNELIQAGFAIAATEANPEPADGDDWDLSSGRSNNDDIDHVLNFLDDLVATTPLEQDTPLLLISFSGASNFVNVFAPAAMDAGYTVGGASLHNGSSWGWDTGTNTFPTIWVTAANEWVQNDVVTEDGPGAAYEAYESHVAAGSLGLYIPTAEFPFTPTRMLRNGDYNEVKAADAFDELVRLGLADADGNRLFPIEEYEYYEKQWEKDALVEGSDRVSVQLEVAWAVHRYSGAHAIQECEFLMPGFE